MSPRGDMLWQGQRREPRVPGYVMLPHPGLAKARAPGRISGLKGRLCQPRALPVLGQRPGGRFTKRHRPCRGRSAPAPTHRSNGDLDSQQSRVLGQRKVSAPFRGGTLATNVPGLTAWADRDGPSGRNSGIRSQRQPTPRRPCRGRSAPAPTRRSNGNDLTSIRNNPAFYDNEG